MMPSLAIAQKKKTNSKIGQGRKGSIRESFGSAKPGEEYRPVAVLEWMDDSSFFFFGCGGGGWVSVPNLIIKHFSCIYSHFTPSRIYSTRSYVGVISWPQRLFSFYPSVVAPVCNNIQSDFFFTAVHPISLLSLETLWPSCAHSPYPLYHFTCTRSMSASDIEHKLVLYT